MKRFLTASIAFLALAGAVGQAGAAPTATPTVVDVPICGTIQRGALGNVSDAYVWEESPEYTGNWEELYTGIVGAGRKRSLLRFDLSSVPAGAELTSARFSIYLIAGDDGHTANLHRITRAWDEESVTWDTFVSGYSAQIEGAYDASGEGWRSVDVLSLVQGWVDGTYPNYGLLLDDPATNGSSTYHSSEVETVALRPKLEVCFVGWPSTVTATPSARPPTRTPTGTPRARTFRLPLILRYRSSPTATSTATATPSAGPPTGTPTATPPAGAAIVVDHTCTDLSRIPTAWLDAAKERVVWVYGHTSHGSQIVSGAQWLSQYRSPPLYHFLSAWYTDFPPQEDPPGLRLGDDDGWSWDPDAFLATARDRLSYAPSAPGQITVFAWSWCGEQSENTVSQVQRYLDMMAQLEREYPAVRFVYMTGHTDAGSQETLDRNNDLVRDYVRRNGKVLYDFADIESWRPDGTLVAEPSDDCPWCASWCGTHPGYCPNPPIEECAHSHSLNCMLKGQAFWWLSARLAGWGG